MRRTAQINGAYSASLLDTLTEVNSTDHLVDQRRVRGSIIHELISTWSCMEGLLTY